MVVPRGGETGHIDQIIYCSFPNKMCVCVCVYVWVCRCMCGWVYVWVGEWVGVVCRCVGVGWTSECVYVGICVYIHICMCVHVCVLM